MDRTPTDERARERRHFVDTALPAVAPDADPRAVTVRPASADASFRSYWRVREGSRSWVLMDAPPEHEDVRPWLDVAARLARAGVGAPRVFAADPERGFVLMSDHGNTTLLPMLDAESVDTLYARALVMLQTMQRDADPEGLPPYDESRLVAEMELMPEWFLRRHLGVTLSCEQWDVVESAFRALVTSALQQPKVFVHRDFHSRNLMLQPGGTLTTIDFQDAVRGPVTYDLVSLLRDCYIRWPEERVYGWVEHYRRRLAEACIVEVDADRFRRWFDLMGLQRHLKVLGIFCRLWYRDGKQRYLADLPLVWQYVREVGARHPDTAPLVALIDEALAGRDITQAA